MAGLGLFKGICFEDILKSVFCIQVGNSSGTCFVCQLDEGRKLIITCKHLFENNVDGDSVKFSFRRYKDGFSEFSGVLLCPYTDVGDICAIVVEDNNSLLPCVILFDSIDISGHISLGSEIFMLGFPFLTGSETMWLESIDVNNIVYPKPIFRHGYTASGIICDEKHTRILLDMHNNFGFSGSPILMRCRFKNCFDFSYFIVGIMCGYYRDRVNFECESKCKLSANINSGIAYCCPLDAIRFRIGQYKRGK